MECDDEEEVFREDTAAAPLALPQSDWRALRCSMSADLKDAATTEEKMAWDMDLLPIEKRPKTTDLEDVDGYYYALGCDKTSSDEDIAKSYDQKKSRYRRGLVAWHEDKAGADPVKYAKVKSKYDKLRRSFEELGDPDDDGCYAKRVAYDKRGEKLREEMLDVRHAAMCTFTVLFSYDV